MTTSKPKNVGRPTVIVSGSVRKVEDILKVGGTIDEACSYAGIGVRTYHDHMEQNEEFRIKMVAARHYSDVVAKNVVVDSIVKDRDLQSAKWWLEKRQFKDSTRAGVSIDDGNKVIKLVLDIPKG